MLEQAIADFFELDRPCPKEIPFCYDIRRQYEAELTELTKNGGCTSCKKTRLKTKYLPILWGKYMENLPK